MKKVRVKAKLTSKQITEIKNLCKKLHMSKQKFAEMAVKNQLKHKFNFSEFLEMALVHEIERQKGKKCQKN